MIEIPPRGTGGASFGTETGDHEIAIDCVCSAVARQLDGSVLCCHGGDPANAIVDLNYFQTGMTRDQVLDKLGAPDTTAIESDEESCDFYKLYTRGYGAGGKVPIAVAEAAADFFTIGLAEAVLTPTEGVTRNEKHPVAFC